MLTSIFVSRGKTWAEICFAFRPSPRLCSRPFLVGIWSTEESFENVIRYYDDALGFDPQGDVSIRKRLIEAQGQGIIGGRDASSRAVIRDNVLSESTEHALPLRSVRLEGGRRSRAITGHGLAVAFQPKHTDNAS